MKKLLYTLLFVPYILTAQTPNENYVKTTKYKVETLNGTINAINSSNLTSDNKQESIVYFDGLGRAKQSISLQAGGAKEDIILHLKYDSYGRQVKQFLPYVNGTNNFNIRTGNLEYNIQNFYKNKFSDDFLNTSINDVNAYSEKSFDNSPLNRVLEQAAPGKDWKKGSNHTIRFDYSANANNEVLNFGVDLSGGKATPELLIANSYYNANELYKTVTKDENWNINHGKDKTTEEFKDKQGRLLLKRTYNNQKPHDTYYVYDDYGNLTYVLPPLASEKTNVYETGTITLPASTFMTGGNPTGTVTFKLEQTGPGAFRYVADFDLHNLANSTFKTGELMDLPFMHPAMGSNFSFSGVSVSESSNGNYSYKYVYYYVNNGKLYCYNYSYGNSTNLVINDFDRTNSINLPQNLAGFSEAQTQVQVNDLLNKLCYQYKYDNRNRLIEKKVAGKGSEYIVYDNLNRPVLVQDANQREISPDEWFFTKYDIKGRVIYTGIFKSNSSRNSLQNSFDGKNNNQNYEVKQNSSGALGIYYSNSHFPTSNLEVLTVNYFDNYNFNRAGAATSVSTVFGINSTVKLNGLATGTKVKVLDTNNWITTLTYYDEKARPIYLYSNNDYLQTTDITENKLDFTGKVLETKTTHKKTGKTDIISVDRLEYDHADRLLTQKQQIGTQAEELITKNTYDEIGQLVKKNVGNTESNSLQEIDYSYNVRGWLKKINDPRVGLGNDLFSMELSYNDQGTRLYNGNISQQYWKTASDDAERYYNYYYDDLNRIVSASYSSHNEWSKFNMGSISYDKNGNIQRLYRRGAIVSQPDATNSSHYGTMDYLTYSYDGNQLKNVDDTGNKNFGFKDGSNTGFVDDYSYDANGNMERDYNKGINSITYNHLNLPKQVNLSQGTIQYKYDATGVKQRKIVSDSGGTTTTDYAGNYIYENNTLQFFSTPEGYAKPLNNKAGFDYIYQYKDHLGNVRLSYKENPNTTQQTVFSDGFESISNWDNTNNGFGSAISALDSSKKKTGSYSGRIDAPNYPSQWSTYVYSDTWTPINNTQDTFYTISAWVYLENVTENRVRFALTTKKAGETGWPSGFYPVRSTNKGSWQYIEKTILVPSDVKEVNVRIENERYGKIWFDDVKIVKGNISNTLIVEESNYYPFGLKHKGYNNVTSPNGNSVAQKFKYNGVELEESLGINLYETYARGYDPTIGRFMQIDPLGELIEQIDKTPYNFAWNNPVFFNDPSGLCPECPSGASIDDIYNSTGGATYVYTSEGWVRQGGELEEITLTVSGGVSQTEMVSAKPVSNEQYGYVNPFIINPRTIVQPKPIIAPKPITTTPKPTTATPGFGRVGVLVLWALFVQPTNVKDVPSLNPKPFLDPDDSSKLPRNQQAQLRVQLQQGTSGHLGDKVAYNNAQVGVTTMQAQLALTVLHNDVKERYKKMLATPQAKLALKKIRAKIEQAKPYGILPNTRTTIQEKFRYKNKTYRFDVESIIGRNLRQ